MCLVHIVPFLMLFIDSCLMYWRPGLLLQRPETFIVTYQLNAKRPCWCWLQYYRSNLFMVLSFSSEADFNDYLVVWGIRWQPDTDCVSIITTVSRKISCKARHLNILSRIKSTSQLSQKFLAPQILSASYFIFIKYKLILLILIHSYLYKK